MSLCKVSIHHQPARKPGSRKWHKNQAARRARRTPSDQIPQKARKGYMS
jgi:hypothetical protein